MYRDLRNGLLGGVCSGAAKRFGTTPLVMRIVFFLLFWFGFYGVVAYLTLWAFCRSE